MKRILVLGAGPQARVIPDVLNALKDIELIGFVDWDNERRFLMGDASGYPVFEGGQFPEEIIKKSGPFEPLIAFSRMDRRKGMINKLRTLSLDGATIIHPSALISQSAEIGHGCLISPGVIIGPGVKIGDHCIINSATTIDHDSTIEENVIMGAGVHLPGFVQVLSGTFIGVGSSSVNGVTIGRDCLIGAGSVITKDVPDNVLAAGVPAKEIRKLK
jgi:sugar O-acyltransferase (sialic acid O-acetyltransferase NeuD family)